MIGQEATDPIDWPPPEWTDWPPLEWSPGAKDGEWIAASLFHNGGPRFEWRINRHEGGGFSVSESTVELGAKGLFPCLGTAKTYCQRRELAWLLPTPGHLRSRIRYLHSLLSHRNPTTREHEYEYERRQTTGNPFAQDR